MTTNFDTNLGWVFTNSNLHSEAVSVWCENHKENKSAGPRVLRVSCTTRTSQSNFFSIFSSTVWSTKQESLFPLHTYDNSQTLAIHNTQRKEKPDQHACVGVFIGSARLFQTTLLPVDAKFGRKNEKSLNSGDQRAVKFFSPSPILICKNWIRSSLDRQKYLKLISPIQSWSAHVKPRYLFCLMRQNIHSHFEFPKFNECSSHASATATCEQSRQKQGEGKDHKWH